MTKRELWERLAKMKGEFLLKGVGYIRHMTRRTKHLDECCPLAALDRGKNRTNDPMNLAARLGLPLDFAIAFTTVADNPVAGLRDAPKLIRLRRKLLKVLGLKEQA